MDPRRSKPRRVFDLEEPPRTSARAFLVTVEPKRSGEHPHFGVGSSAGYAIDGVQGAPLKLRWRNQYTIRLDGTTTRAHPFFIGRDARGGKGNAAASGTVLTRGDGPRTSGAVTFTPRTDFALTPGEAEQLRRGTEIFTFFYACDAHPWMGGLVHLVGDAVALVEGGELAPLTLREHILRTEARPDPGATLTPWRQTLVSMPLALPTFMEQSPHAGGRFAYVGEQTGQIHEIDLFTTVRGGPGGADDPEGHAGQWGAHRPFLDLAAVKTLATTPPPLGERGLLCMAFFPPELLPYDALKPGATVPFLLYASLAREAPASPDPRAHRGCLLRAEAVLRADETLAFQPASVEEILCVEEPYGNHNGGRLAFGPRDQLLYLGLGDGGSQGDPDSRAQSLTSPHGKILRLDVARLASARLADLSPPLPYGIPPGNPFAKRDGRGTEGVIVPLYARQRMIARYNRGTLSPYRAVASAEMLRELEAMDRHPDAAGLQTPLPEIYAWGVRNPWGISFAPRGDESAWSGPDGLIIADVGESSIEELNAIPPVEGPTHIARNLGWPLFEGRRETGHADSLPHAPKESFLFPWACYRHPGVDVLPDTDIGLLPHLIGVAVIGGYVYTGARSPALRGAYVTGDISGWFAAIQFAGTADSLPRRMKMVATGRLPHGHYLRAFAQCAWGDDPATRGEIFALSHNEREGRGAVWQIQWDDQ